MKPEAYKIVETQCYPNRYKIVPVGNWKENNSWTEYFKTEDEARAEIKRRLGSNAS